MSGVRDEKIDALKALAMLFVIVGHAIVYNALFAVPGPDRVQIALGAQQWIASAALNSLWLNVAYSFHMPLFTFLSAYVLFGREGSPLSMLGKRVIGLLVPYLAWIGVSYVSSGGRTLAALPGFYRQRILYPQSPGAAWFLLALFGCFVVFAVVRAVGGRDWMVILSAVLVGGIVVLPVPGGDIFGILDVAWIYPFFAMGYLFAKHAERLAERRTVLMIGGGLTWAVLLPVLWPVLVNDASWWYPALREWLHARHLFGGVAVIYAVRYTCAAGAICALFYAYDCVRGRALSVQGWIGQRTLGMYLIQPYVLALASAYLTKNWVALTAIAFAGSLLGAWLLEQSRATKLVFLGQRSRARLPA